MSSRTVTVALHKGFLGQRMNAWESLDVSALLCALRVHGLAAESREIASLLQDREPPPGYVFYASTQRPGERIYGHTAMLELEARGAKCVVPFGILSCHDNKGMQALVAERLGLPMPRQRFVYLAAGKDGLQGMDTEDLGWPVVLKAVNGAVSSGVWLCRSPEEVERRVSRLALRESSFSQVYGLLRAIGKRFLARSRYDRRQVSYQRGGVGVVLQEFLPKLEHDFKVLVFGDTCYVLQRKVRPRDFRASGSGLFFWPEEVPDAVLDVARTVRERADIPCVSLDVAVLEGRAVCIEFQPVHFGPTTFLGSPRRYQFHEGRWRIIQERGYESLEAAYAYAIAWWVDRRP